MRSIARIFKSIETSYNNKEVVNFVDLRDLEVILGAENVLFMDLVSDYNSKIKLNYTQIRDLELLTAKQ